jgi:hypothetical protein
MALSAEIVTLIRDEIGGDPDFSDDDAGFDSTTQLGSLEAIYTSAKRGNGNVLRTALICWRLRQKDYVKRGFDATASGSLMARRQRMRELDRIVKEYEMLVDTTARHANSTVQSDYQQHADSSEFS